jgi:Uma2 family endonuclease
MAGRVDTKPRPIKLTYEDYVSLPDDGRRYEILDGELVVSPSPTTRHQIVVRNLLLALGNWVRAKGAGTVLCAPLDNILAQTTIVQPDVMYVSKARASIMSERGMEAAPDLVIEILSGSTAARDRGIKKQLYAQYGVLRYWIVNATNNTLDVYTLRGGAYDRTAHYHGDDVVRVDVPEGFELPLAEFWRED